MLMHVLIVCMLHALDTHGFDLRHQPRDLPPPCTTNEIKAFHEQVQMLSGWGSASASFRSRSDHTRQPEHGRASGQVEGLQQRSVEGECQAEGEKTLDQVSGQGHG